MMKKFYAVIAAVLVLSMGTTVFAAKSPSESDGYTEMAKAAVDKIDIEGIEVIGADDTSINVKVEPASPNLIKTIDKDAQAAVEAAVSNGSISVQMGEEQVPVANVLGIVEVEVEDDVEWPVSLSIPVEGVKKGDNVVVMHYHAGTWEVIQPDRVTDGLVTVTLASLSPIAVVKVEASDADSSLDDASAGTGDKNDNSVNNQVVINDNDTNISTNINTNINEQADNSSAESTAPSAAAGSRGTSAATSPKTGQSVPGILILAVFCAAGIAACGWRMKKNA